MSIEPLQKAIHSERSITQDLLYSPSMDPLHLYKDSKSSQVNMVKSKPSQLYYPDCVYQYNNTYEMPKASVASPATRTEKDRTTIKNTTRPDYTQN